MSEVVKSAYMVDPNDGYTLIKREGHDTTEIDREYWQRVNKVHSSNNVPWIN